MDTRFWGPDGWILFHMIPYYLPEKLKQTDKTKIIRFFKLTSQLLPCKYCRMSMTKFIKQLPIEKHCSSREKLSLWVYKIHNKVNNKLRKQGYCITDNPDFEEVDKRFKDFQNELDRHGEFNLDHKNDISNKIKKKTKKIKKGYRNFNSNVKKNSYTKQEVILCNNYIGSIIFNFPNYLGNNLDAKSGKNFKKIVKLHEEYLQLLAHFASRIDKDISEHIKKYIKENPLSDILSLDETKTKMKTSSVLDLYRWYFKLCKLINNDLDHKIDIDKFCKKFKKYIVKTCSNYKTINEKTKKLNTCRKIILS